MSLSADSDLHFTTELSMNPSNDQLVRELAGQRALLAFSIRHASNPPSSEVLFNEACQMAVDLTGAQSAVLLRRRGALAQTSDDNYEYIRSNEVVAPGASAAEHAPKTLLSEVGHTAQVTRTPDGQHLLVPCYRDGKVLAIIDLTRTSGPIFDKLDEQLMADLAYMLNSILQSQYLITARTALVELAQNLSAELDLAALLDKVAEAAAKMAYAQASSILLIQPREQTMRFAAVYGLDAAERETMRQLVVPLQGSMAGSVALTGKPLVSNDVATDPRFYAGVSDNVDTKTRSLLAVPMSVGDQPIGALEVINQKYDDGFDARDIEILSLFASQAAVAIQNARLLAERQASLAEITKLEQRKSQFIALASHELRTPLNLVSGYSLLARSELEEMDIPPDSELLGYMAQIEQATSRLTGMVTNITSMYNLETGRTQLLLENKDINEIAKNALLEYREWARKKGIDLRYRFGDQPNIAVCDPIEVNRIMGNLLNNAVKFTPEGGQIVVSIRKQPVGSGPKPSILVSIADTGPGIDPDQLDSVFERFSQIGSHLNRVEGGIGLGLPLTRALVEKHGGQLWVESELGQGATFTFSIPSA